MTPERNLRLKLGLPVRPLKGNIPFGYVLDKSRKMLYPKQDELELLLEVKKLNDSGVSIVDLVEYIKEKSDIVIARESLRLILNNRAPYEVVKESQEKREQTFQWMSQNLKSQSN